MTKPNGHTPIDYEVVLRDPESVLRKQLGDDLEVLNFESTSFVKVGDNYGSTILKVHALVKRNKDAEKEELNLVAKMLPPTDFQREIFESGFTFKKEIFLYEELIPMYKSLYTGDFDVVPKCYGSRLSVNADADEVDEDAVILMENLKIKGYYMEDRYRGLDPEHLRIAITTLAKFHAIGLSVKQKQPPNLAVVQKYAKPMSVKDEVMVPFLNNTLSALTSDPATSAYVERIKATGNVEKISETYYLTLSPEEPWACVVHCDFWINNALFHRDEKTGVVDDAKLVDFQTYCVSSPLTDLVFFLCTSMPLETMKQDFDEMLELYRNVALEIMKELGCAEELFEKDSFEERLRIDAAGDLFHILLMAKVVELREGEDVVTSPDNEQCMQRYRAIVDIFQEKGWI